MKIRVAEIKDLAPIVEIYNQAVENKFETADTEIIDLKDRQEWFFSHIPDAYPIYVCETNEKLVGWISVSPYRQGRLALRYTVEISYYVHRNFKRQGHGTKLLEYAISECKRMNYRSLFAIILDKNEASINLLTKFGFVKWGHLPNIADFDGVECGHVYYGLRL